MGGKQWICNRKLEIGNLQSGLNPLRQRPEIRHPLQFVIRQFDLEVILQPGEQLEKAAAERLTCAGSSRRPVSASLCSLS
jgi:hypothetical protein